MRSLFISANLLNSKNGGWQCSNRNYESVRDLSLVTDVYNIAPNNSSSNLIKNFFIGLWSIIRLYSGGLNQQHIQNILLKIEEEKYDLVFVDSSIYGKLIKAIRKNNPEINVISFYHNVEFYFILKLILLGNIYHLVRLPSCFFNEYLTAKWSRTVISLTNDDAQIINRFYSKKEIKVIPISFKNTDKVIRDLEVTEASKLITVLFVGSYFYANVQGLKWFIKNVKFDDRVKLIIVGKEMDKFQVYLNPEDNITIYNSVEDISIYYNQAHIVICPIFYGGGMKVKVAEALMYGKKVIGSKLAFLGYRSELCSSMILSEDPEVYKKVIESVDTEKLVYSQSVTHFDRYFSYSSTLMLFKEILISD